MQKPILVALEMQPSEIKGSKEKPFVGMEAKILINNTHNSTICRKDTKRAR